MNATQSKWTSPRAGEIVILKRHRKSVVDEARETVCGMAPGA